MFNNKIRPISSRNKQSETLKKTLSKNNNGISLTKIIYKNRCRFTFNPYQVKNVTGYNLLLEHGIWHPLNNPLGVSRDHIISQEYGWRNNIDPKIISHPANCQWLHQIDNARKKSDSWITLELLLGRIHIWDESVNQINKEIVIKTKELKNSYLGGKLNKIRLAVREKYPIKSFSKGFEVRLCKKS